MTVQVIINPGSGPVSGATEENAIRNIQAWCEDSEKSSGVSGLKWERNSLADEDGRFAFIIHGGDKTFDVDMPGLPLERVRYTRSDDQNIWHFPRLYVDGSSWVWCYSLLDPEIFQEDEEEAD